MKPTMPTAPRQPNRRSGIGVVCVHFTRCLVLPLIGAAQLLLVSTGCSEYRLRGLVVAGDVQRVLVVDKHDPRLDQEGLPDAVLDLTLDPSSMRPKRLGSGMTDARGKFDIPIDAAGAGFLDYELSLLCSVEGYGSVYQIIQRPSGRRRLIVMLVKGGRSIEPTDDALTESMKIHQRVFGPE